MPDDTPAPTSTPDPTSTPPPTATLTPATDPNPDPRHELISAAERAAHTGDRNALLTYMRLKRSLT